MKSVYILIVLFIFGITNTSYATLVDKGLWTEVDHLVTLDTDTGLTWLDLTVTSGDTLDEVKTKLGPGGIYEGWRIATNVQLNTLVYQSLGIKDELTPENDSIVAEAMDILGIPTYGDHWGIFTYDNPALNFGFSIFTGSVNGSGVIWETSYDTTQPVARDWGGFWLVGGNFVTPVPEPSTSVLSFIGIVGIFWFKRYKHS